MGYSRHPLIATAAARNTEVREFGYPLVGHREHDAKHRTVDHCGSTLQAPD